jgi:hypothetical protein
LIVYKRQTGKKKIKKNKNKKKKKLKDILDLENLVTKRITFPATKINTIVS